MSNVEKFYINGEWVTPKSSNSMPVINPANEEEIATVFLGNEDDVNAAVDAAKNAFDSFSKTSKQERLDLLKKIKGEKSIIYVSNSLPEVEQAHDRILVFKDGRIIMDGNLDKLLESTLDYHQFQIEFENLSDDLFKSLSNIATVVSPSRIDNIFHFYGRERNVFFDIVRAASENYMIDLNVKKLGLVDLMDSEFAGGGLD